MRRDGSCGHRSARGFTYLGLLFLIALLGLTAAMAGSASSVMDQRERERELLFVGREYRIAIDRYRQAHAAQPQPYPTELRQLLGGATSEALRAPRFLRRLYADPMTDSLEWGLVRSPQGGILGVYSRSTQRPVRTRGVYAEDAIAFGKALSYRDWVFGVGGPPNAAAGPGVAPPASEENEEGAPPLKWPDGHPPIPTD